MNIYVRKDAKNMMSKSVYPITINYGDYVELVAMCKLAQKFIDKAHHIDGCQKARENWKECTCGKDTLSQKLYEIFEFIVKDGDDE